MNIICGLCGLPSEQVTAGSPAPKNPPDFDTRPGEPLRSTLAEWVQRCPHCGYCADNIASIHDNAVHFVRGESYQQGLNDLNYPEKAREFLSYAAILAHVGQLADAGWSALHGAWACDDAGDAAAAIRCRARAIEYWQIGRASCRERV